MKDVTHYISCIYNNINNTALATLVRQSQKSAIFHVLNRRSFVVQLPLTVVIPGLDQGNPSFGESPYGCRIKSGMTLL